MTVQEFPHGPNTESAENCCDEEEKGEEDLFVRPRTREDAVDKSVKERRRELVNRFYLSQAGGELQSCKTRQPSTHLSRSFTRPDLSQLDGTRLEFEWWDPEAVRETGLLELRRRAQPLDQEESVIPGGALGPLKQLLEEHRIDVDAFGVGKAKSLQQLAAEVRGGVCRLMLDATEHKKLVRVVDFVGLRFLSRKGSGWTRQLLVETEERYPDGRRREMVRLPGTKKRPHESARQAAARIVTDMLVMPSDGVQFDMSKIVRFEREFESPSYPGVRTVYRKEIVEASISSKDFVEMARKIGQSQSGTWTASCPDGGSRSFSWMSEAAARERGVELKADAAASVSPLVRAPVGLSEEALKAKLVDLGVDISSFGCCRPVPRLVLRTLAKAIGLSEEVLELQLSGFGVAGRTRSIRDFSAELVRGEASLTCNPDGAAVRVVDVALLVLRRPETGATLVQTFREDPSGQRTALNRLPAAKCRPDEHPFLGARRILRKQLGVDEGDVVFDSEVWSVQERGHSASCPAIETVLRKRFIFADLRCSAA